MYLVRKTRLNLPGVNFLLKTSGNTEFLGDVEPTGLVEVPGDPISLWVGLEQNGTHLRRFGGLAPNTGSQSNDLFKVAHAILSLVANSPKQNCQITCFSYKQKCIENIGRIWKITRKTIHKLIFWKETKIKFRMIMDLPCH